jgi:hypothetical protein
MSGQGVDDFACTHIYDPSANQEMNRRVRQLTFHLGLKDFKPAHPIPDFLTENLTERGTLPRVQSPRRAIGRGRLVSFGLLRLATER